MPPSPPPTSPAVPDLSESRALTVVVSESAGPAAAEQIENYTAKQFYLRLWEYVYHQHGAAHVPRWLQQHTRLHGEAFSFRQHEFQEEIVADPHYDVGIIKPSQMGLTEAIGRYVMGMLATREGMVAIYTMPTVKEAQLLAKARLDPIIDGSPVLKDLLKPAADSASFKQIGSSQLYMVGTYGKPVISIPTDLLVTDEIDFSNPEALRTAESRLTHSRFLDAATGIRGMRRRFSTPTVPDYGIHAHWLRSDRRKRLCRCRRCSAWFWPDFLEQGVVEGYDDAFSTLTADTVARLEAQQKVDTARLLCPHCRRPVAQDNLGPQYREWVAEAPSVTTRHGYWVTPFDLPDYHTPASILRKLQEYGPETGHFRNFTLGMPYTDATNSVVDATVVASMQGTPVLPETAQANGLSGTVAGLDIGATSWFVVGKVEGLKIHILWLEAITLRQGVDPKDPAGDGYLKKRVLELLHAYGVAGMGCDMYPYTDTILALQAQHPAVRPMDYMLRDNTLPMYVTRENGTLSLHRTKTLDLTAKRINSGWFVFPQPGFPESDVLRRHLQGMKKMERPEDGQQRMAVWAKTGPDHYFHALNYLTVMAEALGSSQFGVGFSVAPSLQAAFVGRKAPRDSQPGQRVTEFAEPRTLMYPFGNSVPFS